MSSLPQTTTKESRLRTRLAARHKQVLEVFHENFSKFNKQLDERQMQELKLLKDFLSSSHSESTGLLQTEMQRVESHKLHLHTPAAEAVDDVIQEPFRDPYHQEGEVQLAESVERIRADRQRLIALGVEMRKSQQMRLDTILKCDETMEATEMERRERIVDSLLGLVETLTSIGYTSVVGAQVLAQRTIHGVNEHLCKNYSARRTLLAQLQCREILLQRHYSRQMAEMYSASLELMGQSSLRWAATFLQTAYFRRPSCHLEALKSTKKFVAEMRHEGGLFLQSIATTVQSLRRARDSLPTECGQICGGTLPDGWLRGFDGGLFSPVFTKSTSEVTVEWRVKANVFVRNAVARCVQLIEKLQRELRHLLDDSEAVMTELRDVIYWVCEPETNEANAWADASQHAVDDVYVRFTRTNEALRAQLLSEVDAKIAPLLSGIQRESEWFTEALSTLLQRHNAMLEGMLLTDAESLLLTFEKVADALETTVVKTLGLARTRFVMLYEARKDHEDELSYLEGEFRQIQLQVRRATTTKMVEKTFMEGIVMLERISTLHTEFHRDTVQVLQKISQEVKEEVERHCIALLGRLGLKSEEQERREREAAAAAADAAERKGGAKDIAVVPDSESELESMLPSYPTLTAVDGETYYVVGPMTLQDGKQLADQRAEPPQWPSKGAAGALAQSNSKKVRSSSSRQQQQQGSKRKKTQQVNQQGAPDSNPSLITPPAIPSPVFVQTYKVLLEEVLQDDAGSIHAKGDSDAHASVSVLPPPMLTTTILLSESAIGKWCEMLRYEVLNWTVSLRRSCFEFLQTQCTAKKLEIDAETNELLRHHRRRCATLQEELFEGRKREIEVARIGEDKRCRRLQDRVAQLEEAWSAIIVDGTGSGFLKVNRGKTLLKQLQELEAMTTKANSLDVLVSQEREFSSCLSKYTNEQTVAYHSMLQEVKREEEVLQAEFRSYLLEHGKTLPVNIDDLRIDSSTTMNNEKKNEEDDKEEEDSTCVQLVSTLLRLNESAKGVKEKIEALQEQEMGRIEAARVSYTAAYNKSHGELRVLMRLHEVFSRLKVQVHSLIALSDMTEAKIEEMLQELEKQLKTPVSIHNFSGALREITSREYRALTPPATDAAAIFESPLSPVGVVAGSGAAVAGGGGGGASGVAVAEDHVGPSNAELAERLLETKADIQRQISASDLTKVFRLIDKFREALYSRGRHLNCLLHGVELFNVPQENYIEPRMMAAPDSPTMDAATTRAATAGTALAAHSSRTPRKSRSCGSPINTLASLYTTADVPDVTPVETQVNEWISAVKTQVNGILDQHFAMYQPPLLRRLPGMNNGTQEDALDACNHICEQQKQSVLQHVSRATHQYYLQVQRVYQALEKMPDYVVNSTYTISATALEQRVATVFDVFGTFYNESDSLRSMYEHLMKVTLSSNHNRSRLDFLCSAEATRQCAMRTAIERFWGFTVREMEEEAAMHAARSINVNNTFFALLRGIVTPEALKLRGDDNGGGNHCNLRQLLRLKGREGLKKEIQQPNSATKRDSRLQETMPRPKQAAVHGYLAGIGGQSEKHSSGKKADATDVMGGAPAAPPVREVEHGRVSLRAFSPLTEFNAAHPEAAVVLLRDELTPAFARVYTAVSHSSSTPAGARRLKSGGSGGLVAVEDRITTIPIMGPATTLHKDTAMLTQQSVNVFNKTSLEALENTNSIFQELTKRDEAWQAMWAASINLLKV